MPSQASSPSRGACPNPRGWLVHKRTRFTRRAGCGKLLCPACIHYLLNLSRQTLLLAHELATINYYVVLTLVGDDVETIKKNRDKFVKYVRRAGFTFEWAYRIEVNPRGTGHHLNGYVRGDFIPIPKLNELSGRAGMGNMRCMMKPFSPVHLDYGTTMITRDHLHAEYLEINGHRLVKQSNTFYRDEHGNPCNKADAEKAVRRLSEWEFSLNEPTPFPHS